MLKQIEHFTKKCNHCNEIKHIENFNKSSTSKDRLKNQCKKCTSILYYQPNREKKLIMSAMHYKENYDKYKEYRENNKKEISKRSSNYSKLNPIKVSMTKKRYRSSESGRASAKKSREKRKALESSGDVTLFQMLELKHYATNCYWCKCSLENVKANIDHYIPLIKGGKHTLSNLVVACYNCNMIKGDKLPSDFIKLLT